MMLVAFAAGCSDGPASPATTVSESATSARAAAPKGPQDDAGSVDQRAPGGLNGFVMAADRIYVAAGLDDQVLAVDPTDGRITARYAADKDFDFPDDVDMLADGTLVVTVWKSGVVDRIGATGEVSELARLGPGVNPVLVRSDGTVFIAKSMTGDGLWTLDPDTGETVQVTDKLNTVNSFDEGPDGQLIGPRMGLNGTTPALVSIDPDTGQTKDIVELVGMATAVEVDGDVAYVTTANPSMLSSVDLSAPAPAVNMIASLPNAPDNLEIADDGSVWISAFDAPVFMVVSDGEVSEIPVGG